MLSNESLKNYYKSNFALMQHHKYSITDNEKMLPWERDIYVSLLVNHIKEQNKRREEQSRRNKNV